MVDGLHISIRNKTRKPVEIVLIGVGRGLRGRDDGGDVTNYNISLIKIVTTNPPCTMNIS
jgi:hypothetical protein